MRWAAGFVPSVTQGVVRHQPAQSSATYPQHSGLLWNCGFNVSAFRRFPMEHGMLTVIGNCLATDSELREQARNQPPFARFMQWPGSYVVVLEEDSRVTILTLPSGIMPVFYAQGNTGITWSTAATPLAALSSAKLDTTMLALDFAVDGLEPFANKNSFFDGVSQVPPGYALTLSMGKAHLERWHTLNFHDDFDAAAVQLRAALWNSITRYQNVRGRVAADLSGGLDSGTLTALAAKRRDFVAVTFTHPTMPSDDLGYAMRLASHLGIQHRIVAATGSEVLHFSGMDNLPVTDQPSNDAILLGYSKAKMRALEDVGASIHMTGMAGDALFDADITYLADMYRNGNYFAAFRAAQLTARRRTAPVSRVFQAARSLARTSYSGAMLDLSRQLAGSVSTSERPAWTSIRWCGMLNGANWLAPASRSLLAEYVESIASSAPSPELTSNFQDYNVLPRIAGARAVNDALAVEAGSEFYHPYLDTEVIDACLSLAGSERVSRPGFKPLLKAAFAQEIPVFLLNRRTKGNFAGMMYEGIRFNRTWLRSLVVDSSLVDMGVIDPVPLAEALERAINGLPAALASLHRFVVLELWHRKLQIRTTDWWKEND